MIRIQKFNEMPPVDLVSGVPLATTVRTTTIHDGKLWASFKIHRDSRREARHQALKNSKIQSSLRTWRLLIGRDGGKLVRVRRTREGPWPFLKMKRASSPRRSLFFSPCCVFIVWDDGAGRLRHDMPFILSRASSRLTRRIRLSKSSETCCFQIGTTEVGGRKV
jgi:hypothetical protein